MPNHTHTADMQRSVHAFVLSVAAAPVAALTVKTVTVIPGSAASRFVCKAAGKVVGMVVVMASNAVGSE